jgi:aminoglycoside phosphotransferase (APT) family kinase protein
MFRIGLYGDEVNFYRNLAASCGTATPRCYYAELDAETQGMAIVLEDLSEMCAGDELEDTTVHELELALDAMASLHASFWPGHSRHDLSAVRASSGVKPAGNVSDWRELPADLRAIMPPAAIDIADRLCEEYPAVRDYLLSHSPQTVVHGDFRLDNVFYSQKGPTVPVTVIDWQTVCRCNGGFDLGWFLSLSLDVDQRRTHEEPLVRHYHSVLTERGVKDYDFDACWYDYRVGVLNAFWREIGAVSLQVGNGARGLQLRDAFALRASTAVADHEGGAVLNRLALA